nr:hypothetical transcript [Hymenolepis microstoma]
MANNAVNLNIVDASVAFQQTHSVMTQALYFGRSFARIGCDFRAHLSSLFSRLILIYFETLMSNALTELSVVLELWPWELVEMSFLSSQSTEGNPEELQAPFEIARHPAIAFFCNRILSAFNGLRICCPVGLRDGILSAFIRALNSAANVIVSAHKSRQLDSSTARSQSTRLASVFAYTAVPHLLTCLLEHIFGGDAASHLWQLHQENDETPTISQLISRFSKDVCAPIFGQWAQLAHGPLRLDQAFASSAENVRYDRTLQAENFTNVVDKPLQNSIESKPSNNAQNEIVVPLINSLANETVTNEVVKSLEEPILNSALIDEEESPKNNALISNQPPVIIASTVIQSPMDQQAVPTGEEPQLPTITNAEKIEVDVLEETDPSLQPDKVAIFEVPVESDGDESQLNATSSSAVQSPLGGESTQSPLKCDLPMTEHQENEEPLSTSKSGLDENSNKFENVELNSEMKEDFVESKIESFVVEPSLSERTFQLSSENLVDENGSSSVLDQVEIISDSAAVERSNAMNSEMKQGSVEIPFGRIEAEDKQAEQIALDFTTGLSSVVNSSDLKLEEPDEPNRERDDLNYTDQSCLQGVNPEVSNKITDLSRTVGHDESASIFMDQPDNVVSDSFNTGNNSEVCNAEYSESLVKVENVKIEESFPDQVGGIHEFSTIQNQINEEIACNTGAGETGIENEEVLPKSELKASLDSLEVSNDVKIGNREKGNWEQIDTDILNVVDGHKEDEGAIYSLNPAENAEPFLHDIGDEPIDLGPSYTGLSPEYKESHDMACIPGLSDAKLENSEDVHEVDSAETLTLIVPNMNKLDESICMDRDGSVWKEQKELSSDLFGKEVASRINDTLTRIEHSEANYFKTEVLEEDSTQSIANFATQEQTSEDVDSPKFGVDQSVEPDESWQDGDDWGKETEIELNNAKKCKADVEPTVQPNLNAQVGSQEIEVKPELGEVSPQKIFPEEDHQGVGIVWSACGIKGDEGADIEVQGVKGSETLPALQSAETITTTLLEKLDDIRRSSDCATESEEPSEETKVGIKQYAPSDDNLVQPKLDILVETQEVETEAGSIKSSLLMELPEEKQKSNFLMDECQEAESAWDADVNEWVEEAKIDIDDIEAKKNFTSPETVIPSEKSGDIEAFLDYHVKSEGTEPSVPVPANKELLEDIPVPPNAVITTILPKDQDDKKESLDYHAKSEFIEPTSTPSDNEISEEVEADNLDGWGKDADVDLSELENKGNVDHTEVTEPALSPHNSGKAEIAVASSEKFVAVTSIKSDHNSLGGGHSKELEKPGLLPCEFPKAADALDENNNALGEGANLDEIKFSSELFGKHPSNEHFSSIEIVGEEPKKTIFDDCECWEDNNWVEERDPTEILPQVSKSDLSGPIEQNPQARLKLDLKVSDTKVENTYWDDDDSAWDEDQDRIKVVPKKSETSAQTPDEKNTLEELEIESTGWGGDENDWGDDVELPRDSIEINKSIADQSSPSTTSLFVPASNEGELEEKRYLINPDVNIGASGTIPKDRSKGAKAD